jgi:hypothetical protein
MYPGLKHGCYASAYFLPLGVNYSFTQKLLVDISAGIIGRVFSSFVWECAIDE